MSVVIEAAQDLGNAVGDALTSVGNAIADVGDFVVNKVVAPIAKTVEKKASLMDWMAAKLEFCSVEPKAV